ncbi:MAG: hypothetical protein KKA54_09960 [Proteobacteria bacterium]|nr:hypothetical protein [Pseudomonadota bacterium]
MATMGKAAHSRLHWSIFLRATLFFFLASIPTVRAATLYVGPGEDYATIGEALRVAVRGDTVHVHAGEYNENISLKSYVDVIGEGADVTTIIGTSFVGAAPITVTANNVLNAVFRGFTVTISTPAAGSIGISAGNSSLTIERNIFSGFDTALSIIGSPIPVVPNMIRNNVIASPDTQGQKGISINISPPVIRNNIIVNFQTGIAAVVGDVLPQVNYNNVFNCTTQYTGVSGGFGALTADPLFQAPVDGDYRLQGASPCIDAGDPTDIIPPGGGTRIDMGAFEYTFPAIVEGPVANVLSETEVEIVWQTNLPTDSRIYYELKAGAGSLEASDSSPVEIHRLLLSDLEPGSTYQYVAQSVDGDGNQATSPVKYFETGIYPDSEPPSVDVTEVTGTIQSPTAVHVTAEDNVGVERIEFFIDGVLQYTVFGDVFDWVINPALFANGGHIVKVVVHDKAGGTAIQQFPIDIYVRPLDVSAPLGGISAPLTGTKVSGGEVSISAWGIDNESGIDRMVISVDGEQLHVANIDGEPGDDEHVSYLWNSHGVENGEDHEITIDFYNNDGLRSSATILVDVQNFYNILHEFPNALFGYGLVKLTRGQVKRDAVYYEAKLYVQNIGPDPLFDVVVEDMHAGFQAVQSNYGYAPRVRFDSTEQASRVTYAIGNLMPGETKECTIEMATVLVTPDPGTFQYAIGKQTKVSFDRTVDGNTIPYSLLYHVPAVKVIEGWWGTTELPWSTATVLAPVQQRDYLVVTHPPNLYNLNPEEDVNALLSELARFVQHKNAVLGYLRSPAAQSEFLNQISNDFVMAVNGVVHAGGWSFRMQPNWRTSGYMLLVGEKEVVPTFTIILTMSNNTVHEVPLSDQIYEDRNNDGYPDITLGRIIGNSAADLIIPIQTSLGVLYGNTGYSFDTSNALLVSGVGNYYTGFVDSVNSIYNSINSLYNPPLVPTKLHVRDYVITGSFGISLVENDDIAVADLATPDLLPGRIILADSAANSIKIYTSSGTLQYQFPFSYDAYDEMAVGDVIGGDSGRPEIVIADKSTDTISIYRCSLTLSPFGGYAWSHTLLATYNMALDNNDQLAIGDLSGDDVEEIVISRTTTGNFRVLSHVSGTTFSLYQLPGTYDYPHDLAVGDVVSGGKDEIVLAEYGQIIFGGNYIYIYDQYGNELYRVPRQLSSGDRLAVAPMLGNSYEDILLMDASDNLIYTFYESTNHTLFADPHESPIILPLDPNDLFAVGQVDDGVLDMVMGSVWGNYIFYYDNDLGGRVPDVFFSMVPGKDVIYFNGHGYAGGWGDVLDQGHFPINLGGVNPFVFATSCDTGDYESDGDNSIAETFLANDAGVYIGSSRMSNTGKNGSAGITFYRDYWRPWLNIGKPFRDMQRYLWSLGDSWWRWVLEYNIYGDPKYAVTPPDMDADTQTVTEKADSADADSEPLSGISIEIPAYEVNQIEGIDHVTIAGGKMLADPGQYEVPYWLEEIQIPAGYELQDVSLVNRSGFTAASGLTLPVVPDDFMEDANGEPFVPEEYFWYPDQPFSWSVLPNDDGSHTLLLMVYPFSINTDTGEIHYYTNYQFSFFYKQSFVEVTNFHLKKITVGPGEAVDGFIEIKNSSDSTLQVRLRVAARSYGGQVYTDGLPLRTVELKPGSTAVVLQWLTGDTPDGEYTLDAVIEDLDGNKLDTASATFSIDAAAVSCPGDAEPDGDVDGKDLGEYIRYGDFYTLKEFVEEFGTLCE